MADQKNTDLQEFQDRLNEIINLLSTSVGGLCSSMKENSSFSEIDGYIELLKEEIEKAFKKSKKIENDKTWLEAKLEMYQQWIIKHPDGFRSLPLTPPWDPNMPRQEITSRAIQLIAKEFMDEDIFEAYGLIFEELFKLGEDFPSPGGSLQRKVLQLVLEAYGISMHVEDKLLIPGVRIGVDLIADQLELRWKSDVV